ncbi:Calcium binding EGF domain protein [Aphelenchoides fujianensis]|nr:Calcium binding EGF domain protein [Aphelenchoides fujianensis]
MFSLDFQGLIKTSNQHFAGGNTDWEERKLGKFKTSETRFVEIMEHVCKKADSVDSDPFDGLKDLQFKCNTMAEEHEELLEKWFFKRQETDPDLFQFVCIDELRKCCADGHYGPACAPCPGALKGAACFGNGKCDGDGTRSGSGKCDCDDGYAGVRCSTCDAHYFAASQNETHIDCKACFDGCARGCTNEEPTGGSYNCECKDGYRRNFDTDECEVDVQAAPYDGYWRPDRMLRAIAIGGLISVAAFVLLFHHRSTVALVSLVVASAVFLLMERFLDESSFTADLKQMLNL